MGWTITIGNAKPYFSKDGDQLRAHWEVECITLPDAPRLPGDPTGQDNCRVPSYCAWGDFVRDAGLTDLFDAELMRLGSSGGTSLLLPRHLVTIREALERRRCTSALPPGWDEDGETKNHDPTLARLIWLEWWVSWALENCETAALEY